MDLSVCIVSWNTCDMLNRCLESIYGTTAGIAYEVIVVDNNSSDDTVRMLTARYPQVRLIANSENLGFARANNQAIRASRGRHIMLLNPDTIVHSGLQEAVAFLDRSSEVGVVGCKALNPDGSIQVSWNGSYPSLIGELLACRLRRRFGRRSANDVVNRVFATAWVGGVCMTIRRDAAHEVGLLDESYFMYTEETDWCRRFRDAGWPVMHSPGVVITHYGGQSTNQVTIPMRVELVRSKLRFISKFRSRREAGIYKRVLVASAALRELVARALWIVAPRNKRFREAARTYKELRVGITGIAVETVGMDANW